MFADQKRNIADAVPAGFSLADISGLAGAGEPVRNATHSTRRTEERVEAGASSAARWLLPLAVLIVGALLLWNFLKPRPADQPVAQDANQDAATTTVMKPVVPGTDNPQTMAMPDAARMTDSVKGILAAYTDELSAIRDSATAEAALPKLEELKTKLDGIRATWTNLPEAGQSALREVVNTQMAPLKQKAQETLAVPGLGDRIKSLINEILQRLAALATQPSPAANP
jgi:hypothetical protein